MIARLLAIKQQKRLRSLEAQLAEAKRECAERTPPENGREGRKVTEHGDLLAAVRNGVWNGPSS